MEASSTQLIEHIITYTLLCGGFLTAIAFGLHLKKNPVNREDLTATIADRSWSIRQLFILLASLFTLFFAAGFTGRFFYEEQLPVVRLVVAILVYALLVAVTAIINAYKGWSWDHFSGMGIKNLKMIFWAPVFYLAAIPFILLLSKSYHLILEMIFLSEVELQEVAQIVSRQRTWLEWCYIGTAIILAPIYEEIIFRGVLFPFVVKRTGLILGTLMVSALFALIHFHLPSVIALSLLSALLCLAYWKTGSLWTSIGIHMIFNAVTILALNISA